MMEQSSINKYKNTMSLTTKAIQNLALKQNKVRSQGDRLAVIVDLVVDLGWEFDRLSDDGKYTYNVLCEKLNLPTSEDFNNG